MEYDSYQTLVSESRRHGVRITHQRKAILRALCELHRHATAEEIHKHAARYHEHVDLSTIYRTLDMLHDLHIVSRTDLGQGRALYELLSNNFHHHLVCQCCGVVTDLDEDYLAPMAQVIQQDFHFKPLLDHVAIFGVCERCDKERHPADHAQG